jgi:hypothetical protein
VEDHLVEVRSTAVASDIPLRMDHSSDGMVFSLTNPVAVLEEADQIAGPFTAVPNAANPCTVPMTSPMKFYRLRLGSKP